MKTLKQFLYERINNINSEYQIPKIELWKDKEQINMWTQECASNRT